MTVEQLVVTYRLFLQSEYELEEGRQLGDKAKLPSEHAEHVLWMLDQILFELHEDPMKLMRWLGFVQGVLWCGGDMRIKDIREQTRGLTLE